MAQGSTGNEVTRVLLVTAEADPGLQYSSSALGVLGFATLFNLNVAESLCELLTDVRKWAAGISLNPFSMEVRMAGSRLSGEDVDDLVR
jgi:hypothetical protein